MSDFGDKVWENPRTDSGVVPMAGAQAGAAIPAPIPMDLTPPPVDPSAHPIPKRAPVRASTPAPRPPTAPDLGHALAQMQGTLNTLMTVLSPEQQEQLRQVRLRAAEDDASFEEEVTPKGRAWKAAKWALGVLIGGAVAIFGVGAGYQKAIGNNATKADIKEHATNDLGPVKTDVEVLKADMKPVKEGVTELVDAKKAEKKHAGEVRRVQRLLAKHEEAFEIKQQTWAADRAAGQRRKPPSKTDTHLAIEAELEELEDGKGL